MNQILQAFLFMLIAGYVLSLIPCAVITGLKNLWLLLALGFLTFGLVWVFGSLVTPERDSWWDRKFGSSIANRSMDEAKSASRRQAVSSIVIVAGGLITISLFSIRPNLVVGNDGRSLQQSVGGPSVLDPDRSCSNAGDGGWDCDLPDGQERPAITEEL